ncbi:uncharacterized protein KGF55_001132 [Candida pseudojiufengensis]|uniref:uncharacterized protein n=1 Tax=Candida pseudojiufengensis TaxID=497109 RepID=UPI002224BD57|nr:uncharacterized protein KGF55_001132 [Candida pseudojiufengensis]KAI5965769.1 hypothetical protein KGF55_001132 [Candida pseudojiufengensis]
MSNPQEEVYKQYLNYDWDSNNEFQKGLSKILESYKESLKEQNQQPTISSLDQTQLINQAKSFFFCQQTGHILNLEDFEDWKIHNGDKFKKDNKIEEIEEFEDSTTTNDDPPYSSNYQNLAELIMSGKPVPGIKDIPDTVLTDQGSESQKQQRVKPWEKVKEKEGN